MRRTEKESSMAAPMGIRGKSWERGEQESHTALWPHRPQSPQLTLGHEPQKGFC